MELNYIQPIGDNFGVQPTTPMPMAHATGDQPLQGTSKNTYNVSGYFENERFNARVSYTYRSSFYAGVSRTDTYYQAGYRQPRGLVRLQHQRMDGAIAGCDESQQPEAEVLHA